MTDLRLDVTADLVTAIERTVLGRQYDSFDVVKISWLTAGIESANYYVAKMLLAETARDPGHLLDIANARRSIDGLVLEFGVASGRTINHLANLMPDHLVHGFDWFGGLPEAWRTGFGPGAFAQPLPEVRENVRLIPGLFQDTLPGFVQEQTQPVSLLHVDCDLYSSTVTIFQALRDRIIPGTVIVFDEYFNYPGWRQHEFRAFQEFIAGTGRRYEYVGFVPHHQQVCAVITG